MSTHNLVSMRSKKNIYLLATHIWSHERLKSAIEIPIGNWPGLLLNKPNWPSGGN